MPPSIPLDEFESRVYTDCVREGLFPRGSKILLACSGGPDSTALFHAFLRLSKEWELTLVTAHLNHKTREEESDQDAEFVQKLSRDNGLTCHVRECNVKAWAEQEGYSFQEGARLKRQAFFDEIAREEGCAFILPGHHADDQAETVLMNLMRGAGPLGIAGIPFIKDKTVRPLLYRSRKEILHYLERRGFVYRVDSSNEDTGYLRNRVRRELIPYLQENYSPRLASHLSSLSHLLGQDETFLSEMASEAFERIHERRDGMVFLPAGALAALPPAIIKRVLRRGVEAVKGNLLAVEFSHIESIQRVLEEGSGAVVLPGDIQVSFGRDGLRIQKLDRESRPPAGPRVEKIRLNIPGATEIPPAGVTIQAVVNPPGTGFKDALPSEAFLDKDRVGDTIWVRFSEAGDRFWPLGGPGPKKLKSFFIDQKIPVEQRRNTPVLTDGQGDIIWVYGQRISDRFKVVPETCNILYLKGVE